MSFLNSELITDNSELEEAEIIPKEPGRVMLPREKGYNVSDGKPCEFKIIEFSGFFI